MRIPIDLGEKTIYIELEEFRRYREHYEKLQQERIGKCTTKHIP